MGYLSDWEKIKAKINNYKWADSIYRKMRQSNDWWVENYRDDAEHIAGWGHNYFCTDCGGKLLFDPAREHECICSKCGREQHEDRIDQAWNYLYRDEVHKQAFYSAVLYRLTGEGKYLDFIRNVMNFYCVNYEQLKVNVPEGYIGKIAGIDLSDAVGVVWMLNALETVREELTPEELQYYKKNLFLPETEIFNSHSGKIYNIPCWMKAAEGMIGLFFNEPAIVERAFYGEYGILNQLRKGVTKDGFWYECSMHYHFYCLEALTYLLYFFNLYPVDTAAVEEIKQIVKQMYRIPVELAFRSGFLPNPNDGWPKIHLNSYAGQYEFAAEIFDEPVFKQVLAEAYSRPGFIPMLGGMCDNSGEGWVQRLLFGKECASYGRFDFGSFVMEDTGFGMLRNRNAELFIKYGLCTPSHSHPDLMNIELSIFDELISYDLSSNGYSSFLFREWQRLTPSHSTVAIDMSSQVSRKAGELLLFDKANRILRTAHRDVYPGVNYERTIKMEEEEISDKFAVSSADEHVIDWFFHCKGDLQSNFIALPSHSPFDQNGYQHLMDIREFRTDDSWTVRWVLPDKELELKIEGCPGTTVYLFRGYEASTDQTRCGIMVRRNAADTVYQVCYKFRKRGP